MGQWKKYKITEEDEKEIVRKYHRGISIYSLSLQYDCSATWIRDILRRRKAYKPKRINGKRPDPTPEEIEERKKQIQDTWDEQTEKSRRGVILGPYIFPVVRL